MAPLFKLANNQLKWIRFMNNISKNSLVRNNNIFKEIITKNKNNVTSNVTNVQIIKYYLVKFKTCC